MRRLTMFWVVLGSVFVLPAAPAALAQQPPLPATDLPSGVVRQFGSGEFRDGFSYDIDLSPDGRVLAHCGARLRLWNVATRKELPPLPLPTDSGVSQARFAPDGKHLACLHWNQQVTVWDWPTGKRVLTLAAEEQHTCGLAFSHDSRLLATGNDRGEVVVWRLANGEKAAVLDRHRQLFLQGNPNLAPKDVSVGINHLAFSADGKYLATSAYYSVGQIVLWNAATFKEDRVIDELENRLDGMAFSPDGRHFVASGDLKQVPPGSHAALVWDLATGKVVHKLHKHRALADVTAYSPDGRKLAFADRFGRISVWDLPAGKIMFEAPHTYGGVVALRFTADSTQLFAAGNGIALWDLKSGQDVLLPGGHNAHILGLAISADATTIASAGSDCTVRLWDAATGKQLHVLFGHQWPVNGVAFSPDGRVVASAGQDMGIKLWDVAGGKLLRTIQHPAQDRRPFYQVAFSKDGMTLLAASDNFSVWYFNVGTGQATRQLRGYNGLGISAQVNFSWSADQQTLAMVGGGGVPLEPLPTFGQATPTAVPAGLHRIELWDVPSGQRKQVLGNFRDIVTAALSPDGKSVVAAGWQDGTTWWDVASSQRWHTLPPATGPVLFSPDGRILAVGHRLYLDGPDHPAVELPMQYVRALAFTPQSDRLLVCPDSMAVLWLWDLKQMRKKQ
jgi:WD40 repeat protein